MMISTTNPLNMIQIDFSPVFQYLDTKFKPELIDELKEIFVTKDEFRRLQTSVDANIQEIKDFRVEMNSLIHRTDRIEDWVEIAGPEIKLPYER